MIDFNKRLNRKNLFDGNLILGSKKFNEDTERNAHVRKIEECQSKWVDSKTGILKKEFSYYRNCPLCGSDNSLYLFIKNGFIHVQCYHCSMVYVNPILRKDIVEKHYLTNYSYNNVLSNPIQIEFDKSKFNYLLDVIEYYKPNKGLILDIGCGNGQFLDITVNRGWHPEGCELNSYLIEGNPNSRIVIHNCSIEKIPEYEQKYDCITMWTVLEHIVEPDAVLKKLHSLLRKGGLIAILVPNIDALSNRILHEKSTTFSGENHISHFNAYTLSKILIDNGFQPVECETILTNIGVIQDHLNYNSEIFSLAQTGSLFSDIFSPEMIHKNMLGYLLFMIARVTK